MRFSGALRAQLPGAGVGVRHPHHVRVCGHSVGRVASGGVRAGGVSGDAGGAAAADAGQHHPVRLGAGRVRGRLAATGSIRRSGGATGTTAVARGAARLHRAHHRREAAGRVAGRPGGTAVRGRRPLPPRVGAHSQPRPRTRLPLRSLQQGAHARAVRPAGDDGGATDGHSPSGAPGDASVRTDFRYARPPGQPAHCAAPAAGIARVRQALRNHFMQRGESAAPAVPGAQRHRGVDSGGLSAPQHRLGRGAGTGWRSGAHTLRGAGGAGQDALATRSISHGLLCQERRRVEQLPSGMREPKMHAAATDRVDAVRHVEDHSAVRILGVHSRCPIPDNTQRRAHHTQCTAPRFTSLPAPPAGAFATCRCRTPPASPCSRRRAGRR
eukprot:ctg_1033.g441